MRAIELRLTFFSLFSVFFFSLFGCVSTSTVMVSDNGQQINCGATGFGYIGAPAALVMTENCKAKAGKAGYKDLNDAYKPVVLSGPQGAAIQSQNGAVRINLPNEWHPESKESNLFKGFTYDLYVSTLSAAAFFTVQTIDLNIIPDWESYFSAHRAALATKFPEIMSSSTKSIAVSGRDALMYEVTYIVDKRLVRRVTYIVKSEKRAFLLVQWAEDGRFDASKPAFDAVLKATQFL
jgi:hypothetical protein